MILYEPIYRNIDGENDAAARIDTESLGGGQKYICWFEGQQSTNLWYYKRLIISPDTNEVTVKVSENSIYRIYDPSASSGDFIDNNKILKTEVTLSADDSGFICIYVVGCAEEPGEFIDYITIDDEKVYLGMEVYGENEILKINTQNMGTSVANDIARAIYTTDIYEERPDWIVLNNKWKELLVNLMDVMGCKGSYKSLLNSLEWFNYGKLIELREVWTNENLPRYKYMDRPINRWLSEWYNKSLVSLSKTTYFVLRQCSVDLSKRIGTELADNRYPANQAYYVPIYQPYTYDPERIKENDLTETEVKWAKDEMRMKMQLLAMYFELNFMPIHLDILRSSVEDIFFDVPGTLHMAAAAEIEDWCTNSLNDMDVYSDGKDNEPDEDGYDVVIHLDQQRVYGADWEFNHSSTPKIKSHLNFGLTIGESNMGGNFSKGILPPILGVTYNEPPSFPNDPETQGFYRENMALLAASWFNEIGAVAEFEIATKGPVNKGKIITNIINPEYPYTTRSSDIESELCMYNVDWDGQILNHDPVYEDAIEWQPGMTYYKQILNNQYCIVNQYGLPAKTERYLQPEPDWILWTEDVEWDDTRTYYKQTTTATYVMVNARGQQISDDWLKEIPAGALEWNVGLHYKRLFYKTIIRLLCQKPGDFWVLLTLSDGDTTYNRKLNIKVVDNLSVHLEFFKLKFNEGFEGNPFNADYLGPNKNMFVTTRDPDTNPNIHTEQGWKTWKERPQYTNTRYELPATILPDYKYQQYLNLSTYETASDFVSLGDKPRLSWVATIYPSTHNVFSNFYDSISGNLIDSELCPSELDKSGDSPVPRKITWFDNSKRGFSGKGFDEVEAPNGIPSGNTNYLDLVYAAEMTGYAEGSNNPGPIEMTDEQSGSHFNYAPRYVPDEHQLVRRIHKEFIYSDHTYENNYYCLCNNDGSPIRKYSVILDENLGYSNEWVPTEADVYEYGHTTPVKNSSKELIEWQHDMQFRRRDSVNVDGVIRYRWIVTDRHNNFVRAFQDSNGNPPAVIANLPLFNDYFNSNGTQKYNWSFYRLIDDEYVIVDAEWGGPIFIYPKDVSTDLNKTYSARTYSLWSPNVVKYREVSEMMDDPEYVEGMTREDYLAIETVTFNDQEFYIKRGFVHQPQSTTGRLSEIYNDDNIVIGKIKYIQYIPKELPADETAEHLLEHLIAARGFSGSRYVSEISQKYIPEYHLMEHITVNAPKDSDIPDTYPIVAVPVIEINVNGEHRDLTWSHKLNSPSWYFMSFTTATEATNLKFNIQQPFIANDNKMAPISGRYNVFFMYKWGDDAKLVSRMSPFNIIHED